MASFDKAVVLTHSTYVFYCFSSIYFAVNLPFWCQHTPPNMQMLFFSSTITPSSERHPRWCDWFKEIQTSQSIFFPPHQNDNGFCQTGLQRWHSDVQHCVRLCHNMHTFLRIKKNKGLVSHVCCDLFFDVHDGRQTHPAAVSLWLALLCL